MTHGGQFSAAQCRAGRALLGMQQDELARAAKVARKTLADFEGLKSSPHPRTLAAIRDALEASGVIFIDENGRGPGVQLRTAEGGWVREIAKRLPSLIEGAELVGVQHQYGNVEIDIVARDQSGQKMLIEVAGSSLAVPRAAKRLVELVQSGLAPADARLMLIAIAGAAIREQVQRVEYYRFLDNRLQAA